jgi:hypothetical protein
MSEEDYGDEDGSEESSDEAAHGGLQKKRLFQKLAQKKHP